jgi:nucleoside-diphosphate-sugar epimerase
VNILVTGGAGMIGGHLVRRLLREGAGPITVFDNFHRASVDNLAGCLPDIRLLTADVRDPSAVAAALHGVDLVYHLAAQASVMAASVDLTYTFDTNVQGSFYLFRAAKAAGVRRVVFASSREVYGAPDRLPVNECALLRPKNPYGASKAAAEAWCRAFAAEGLEVVILRLANVYGPGDRDRVLPTFIDRALGGQPLILYGGDQVLDFVWIDEVVESLWKAGVAPCISEPVNIASGKGVALVTAARRVLDLTGSASSIEIAPPRPAEVVSFVADITRARELLSLRPPRDPLFGLAALLRSAIASARRQENASDKGWRESLLTVS